MSVVCKREVDLRRGQLVRTLRLLELVGLHVNGQFADIT